MTSVADSPVVAEVASPDVWAEKSLPRVIGVQAASRPDAVFIKTADRVVTYGEAFADTTRWA